MRKLLFALALPAALVLPAALACTPAMAADPWGLKDEKTVSFPGKVVDILCTLKGDCPAACGAGKRQLGILATDGKLYTAAKSNTLFAGTARDLVPWCGKTIEIDGLLVENPAMPILMVQGIREKASEAFMPTEQFEKDWTAANGKADEWWRADPTAKTALAENGILGRKDLKWPK